MKNDMGTTTTRHHRFFKQVYSQTSAGFFRNVAFGTDNTLRKYTLLILLLFGLAGVLIDLDHLIIEETQMVRPLHLPCFFGVWIVGICYYAYLHRRVHKHSVVKGKYDDLYDK